MSTRFLILCKSLAKNGVMDIQVNLANNNETYIPKTGKIMLRGFYVEFVQRGHIISMFDHSGNISKYASLVSQTQLPFHRVFSLDSLTVVYIPSTVQSIDQAP